VALQSSESHHTTQCCVPEDRILLSECQVQIYLAWLVDIDNQWTLELLNQDTQIQWKILLEGICLVLLLSDCMPLEHKTIACDLDCFANIPIPLCTYKFLYHANLHIMRVISFISYKKFLVKVLSCPPDTFFLIWFVRLLALRPLLAYCASLGWQWKWLWRSRWNVDWQEKPKFSEKTCPSATFAHHQIPHDQTRVWTRAAAVGSRRLTAWAMTRPLNNLLDYCFRGSAQSTLWRTGWREEEEQG
jgi:hypothetical protein